MPFEPKTTGLLQNIEAGLKVNPVKKQRERRFPLLITFCMITSIV